MSRITTEVSQRAARRAGRARRRRPHRARHHLRPGRRRQLRRAVGEHRRGRGLRRHGRRHRGVVDGYPGLDAVRIDLSGPAHRPGARRDADSDVAVRVYGQDLAVLRAKAERGPPGARGASTASATPRVERPTEEPTIEIEVDLGRPQRRYGIKPGDVRRAAATLLSGLEVGNLFEEQKVFDVVVWGTPEIRAAASTSVREPADRHARRRARPPRRRRRRCASSPTPSRHPARDGLAPHRRDRGRQRPRARRGASATSTAGLRRIRVPARVPRRGAQRLAEQQTATTGGCWLVAGRAAVGIFLLLQAAFGSWRLAALALPGPAAGAVSAALLGRPGHRRRHLAGRAGRACSRCSASPSAQRRRC